MSGKKKDDIKHGKSGGKVQLSMGSAGSTPPHSSVSDLDANTDAAGSSQGESRFVCAMYVFCLNFTDFAKGETFVRDLLRLCLGNWPNTS